MGEKEKKTPAVQEAPAYLDMQKDEVVRLAKLCMQYLTEHMEEANVREIIGLYTFLVEKILLSDKAKKPAAEPELKLEDII